MGKEVRKPIDARNFGCDVSVRLPARTDSGGGEGGPKITQRGGGECQINKYQQKMWSSAFRLG